MSNLATEEIYIAEASELLNRRPGTLRKWEADGVLPKHLIPARGTRGWRCWTREQIEGIRQWIAETERFPGKGLSSFTPSIETTERQVEAMRVPRKADNK